MLLLCRQVAALTPVSCSISGSSTRGTSSSSSRFTREPQKSRGASCNKNYTKVTRCKLQQNYTKVMWCKLQQNYTKVMWCKLQQNYTKVMWCKLQQNYTKVMWCKLQQNYTKVMWCKLQQNYTKVMWCKLQQNYTKVMRCKLQQNYTKVMWCKLQQNCTSHSQTNLSCYLSGTNTLIDKETTIDIRCWGSSFPWFLLMTYWQPPGPILEARSQRKILKFKDAWTEASTNHVTTEDKGYP